MADFNILFLFFRLKQISEETDKLNNSFSSSHLDQSVGTISLRLPTPLDKQCVEDFLQKVLWEDDEDLDNNESDNLESSSRKKQEIWRLKVNFLIKFVVGKYLTRFK